ncbi:MAG: DMT family transporter [Alphaproteobacteria bacterium]|nr:DMT family transporter [Alphaproteobacteria bacterium]
MLGLLVMLAWAGNTIVIKFITFELTPFTALSIRLAIACICFLPFLRWPGKAKFLLIAQITLFMAILHWGSLIWAIDKLDASMAAILMQTQVIFAVIIGRFFFAEKFGWRTGVGILAGITGIAILVGLPQNPPALAGVLGMIFSMITIAISYARMKGLKDISPLNYMAHMHLIALLPVTALAFLLEAPLQTNWEAINYTTLIPALLYQVIIVSAAHMLWQRLMTRNAMSGLPNLTLLLPVLGVTMAVIFLGEKITGTMIAGGLVTMIGVGIVMIRKQKRIEN